MNDMHWTISIWHSLPKSEEQFILKYPKPMKHLKNRNTPKNQPQSQYVIRVEMISIENLYCWCCQYWQHCQCRYLPIWKQFLACSDFIYIHLTIYLSISISMAFSFIQVPIYLKISRQFMQNKFRFIHIPM